MVFTWRVVMIRSDGTRIVVAERLSLEMAAEIRGHLASRGKNVIVELDLTPDESPNRMWSTGDQLGSSEDILMRQTFRVPN